MDKEGKQNNPETKQKDPLYTAQSCPVCNGFGTLKYGTKVCQACGGKGYILVPNYFEGRKDGNEGSIIN